MIVTPPPEGGFGMIGTPPLPPPFAAAPVEGLGAMGIGVRRAEMAVPPGENSWRRALEGPDDDSLSWREERGDSRPRGVPRDLSLGWIKGDAPDVLIPPIGVGRATSL